jgi:hypothetical protein
MNRSFQVVSFLQVSPPELHICFSRTCAACSANLTLPDSIILIVFGKECGNCIYFKLFCNIYQVPDVIIKINVLNCFRFATQSDSGLLLYNGRYNEKHDFIALEIVGGSVHFSFSLGSNVTTTVASLPGRVSDGSWHSVTVHYFNKVKKIMILLNCTI